MGIFGGLFNSLMNAVSDVFGNGMIDDMDDVAIVEMFESHLSQLSSMVTEITPFALKADDSYLSLKYNKLDKVPAIELYDGNYQEKLVELMSEAETLLPDSEISLAKLDKIETEIKGVATQIQTYLKEPTSTLEEAKLWDSKFVKGVNEHIPPHYKKGEYMDDVMSEVMRAFRNWSSFAQASIDLYGSQRLINATYEAVIEGEDAMDYMSEILDLNTRENSTFGGDLHEDVIVPYAGFFGSGFFF
nr:MAG TPA: hypothetical protein [Caudoviricetes sp.]